MHRPPWTLAEKEVLTRLVEKRRRFESEENPKASTWRNMSPLTVPIYPVPKPVSVSNGDRDAKPSKKSQKNKAQKFGESDQEDPVVTNSCPDSVEDDADNLLEFAQQISSVYYQRANSDP
jgi:hypothetical protein